MVDADADAGAVERNRRERNRLPAVWQTPWGDVIRR